MNSQPAEGQGSLLELPLSDPDVNMVGKAHTHARATERDAAERIMPKTGTQRRAVLQAIAGASAGAAGGLTDEEITDATGITPSSERPRRVELVEGGWVRDSGRTRPTRSGASATVWTLAQDDPFAVQHPGFNCAGDVR